MKLMTCTPLPATQDDFFGMLTMFFPTLFDIKYIMKYCENLPGAENLKGGLNRLAEALQVRPPSLPPPHTQAFGPPCSLGRAAKLRLRVNTSGREQMKATGKPLVANR